MNEKELVLNHVKIIFSELTDKGFGRNITIDVTDPKVQQEISDWAKYNNVQGGAPKFKKYEGKDGKVTMQYSLKISDYTKIEGKDGLGEANLGYGAVVNLIARAFEYNNKFGSGVSASLAGIYVIDPAIDTTMSKIAE